MRSFLVALPLVIGCQAPSTVATTGDAGVDSAPQCDVMATPTMSSFTIAETSPAMTMATDACPASPGTDEEIARTPRARPDLEQLVMHLTRGFTANEEAYRRVERDVLAITSCGEFEHFRYRPYNDGKTVALIVDDATATAIEAHTYSAWDCLNARYDVRSVDVQRSKYESDIYVKLVTKGTYATDLLAKSYDALPGVLSATASGAAFDGSTICLRTLSGTWDYLFVQKGGDCPAGCTEDDWYWLTTTPEGVVELRGRWGTHEGPPNAIDPSILEFADTCDRP